MEWIKRSEQEPPKDRNILVFVEGECFVATNIKYRKCNGNSEEFTCVWEALHYYWCVPCEEFEYWMPLPNPPGSDGMD